MGEDVKHDSDEFELFIKEVYKEMTIKAGQKCTAIRRILVPENLIEKVQIHQNHVLHLHPKRMH